MTRLLLMVCAAVSLAICAACLIDLAWYGGYDCCVLVSRPDCRTFSWHWVEPMTISSGRGGPRYVGSGWILDGSLGDEAVVLVWRVRRGSETGWHVWVSYWPVAGVTALLPLYQAWVILRRRRRAGPGFPVLPISRAVYTPGSEPTTANGAGGGRAG